MVFSTTELRPHPETGEPALFMGEPIEAISFAFAEQECKLRGNGSRVLGILNAEVDEETGAITYYNLELLN